jgi:hypothetical protein
MKTFLKWKILAVLAATAVCGANSFADLEVSAGISIHAAADFEVPLAPLGTWVDVGAYGHCWHPRGVAVDWRPYCDGRWEYTDCGWYWDSEEPWGWACCHYGSWVDDPTYGWLWVPGTDWAPAWVSWRIGDGYIGWAPMPPRRVGFEIGISVPAASFVFVQGGHFSDHLRPSSVIVNNTTIINRTTVINNGIRAENRTFEGGGPRRVNVNVGPPIAEIQKTTGHQFRPVAVSQVVARHPAPRITSQPGNREQARQPEQLRQGQQATPTPPEQNRQTGQSRQEQLNRDQQRSNNQRDQNERVRTTAPQQPAQSAPERERQQQQQQRNLTQPREAPVTPEERRAVPQTPQREVAPTPQQRQPTEQRPPAIPKEQPPVERRAVPIPEQRQPAVTPREQSPPAREVTPAPREQSRPQREVAPQQKERQPQNNPGQERKRDDKPGQN